MVGDTVPMSRWDGPPRLQGLQVERPSSDHKRLSGIRPRLDAVDRAGAGSACPPAGSETVPGRSESRMVTREVIDKCARCGGERGVQVWPGGSPRAER